MKSLIYLSDADQSRLDSIIHRTAKPPYPDPKQATLLQEILAAARNSDGRGDLLTHASFGDLVTLVSPSDSRDYYRFRIVMPHECDVDRDHISILMPIALAILGRAVGERVRWPTPAGPREMRIIAVHEPALLPAGPNPTY